MYKHRATIKKERMPKQLQEETRKLDYCCVCRHWLPNRLAVSGVCTIVGTGTTDGMHSCGEFELLEELVE
jgi:hypothetical protein